MNVIVDTNIVFSAVLNSAGKIGDLLLNSHGLIQFFGCDFLKEELLEHHEKLKGISNLSDAEIQISKGLLFSRITFIDTRLLPASTLIQAEGLVENIDPDDTEHVALALHLECKLWSGDKKLRRGLREKDIFWVLNTDEMWETRTTLQS